MSHEFRIAVFPGDGIGREVMAPCLALLEAVTSQAPEFRLRLESHEAGAELYLKTGVALPEATVLDAAASADAILLGAMGHPDVRYPNGTEVVPQIDLRDRFQLYAGLRPIRVFPGVRIPLADPRAHAHRFRDRPRVHRRAVRGADREPSRRRRSRPRHDAHHTARLASGCSSRRSRSRAAGGVRSARPGSPASTRPTCCRRWPSFAASFSNAPRAIPTSPRTASTSMPPRCGWCNRRGISTSSSPRTCSATSSRIWAPA